jgi:hypothetical protein
MPVGDCQREFGEAAVPDGIILSGQKFPWLSQQGHLALPEGSQAREVLRRIYVALGGDEDILGTARSRALPGDYLHEPTRTLIEIDEVQHFTSARFTALEHYPGEMPLGFDLEHYKSLCRRHSMQADKYRASKEARGFGPGGRTRQRATTTHFATSLPPRAVIRHSFASMLRTATASPPTARIASACSVS